MSRRGRRIGWEKSVAWVDIPYTRTERRWANEVREGLQTAIVHPKRYQNIDTGKFETSKIPSIASDSLAQIIDDHRDLHYPGYPEHSLAEVRADYERVKADKKKRDLVGRLKDINWDIRVGREVKAKPKQKSIQKPMLKAIPKPLPKASPKSLSKPLTHPFAMTGTDWHWQDEQEKQERIRRRIRLEKEHREEMERQRENTIPKHWVYHPDFPARIVNHDEYESYLSDGWYDTPAKFAAG